MPEHMIEWLSPYLDGELRGSRLHHVEAHLAECASCQAELDSLKRVSSWLSEAPVPEFTSTEHFASQVSLRLPQRRIRMQPIKVLELGWWMIPVGLLCAWVLVSLSFLIGDVVSGATRLGLLTEAPDWIVFGSSSPVYWSRILARVGVLRGTSLDWASSIEALARTALPQITLQLWIALLYLSWIAIWWARRRPRMVRQPLEG
ncbi:MAG TPA: zf-HC2 domain-containing protein [Anaerolineales bacterium]|nr:zf-HC2 domain-containing protein [Anaerolineales bacterium]